MAHRPGERLMGVWAPSEFYATIGALAKAQGRSRSALMWVALYFTLRLVPRPRCFSVATASPRFLHGASALMQVAAYYVQVRRFRIGIDIAERGER